MPPAPDGGPFPGMLYLTSLWLPIPFRVLAGLPRYFMLAKALHGSLENLNINVTREQKPDVPPIKRSCQKCKGCITAGRVPADVVDHMARGIIDFSKVEAELVVDGEPAQTRSIAQQSPTQTKAKNNSGSDVN